MSNMYMYMYIEDYDYLHIILRHDETDYCGYKVSTCRYVPLPDAVHKHGRVCISCNGGYLKNKRNDLRGASRPPTSRHTFKYRTLSR